MKLQRYDFGGRNRRMASRFGREGRLARAWLRRIAVAAILLTAAIGAKRYAAVLFSDPAARTAQASSAAGGPPDGTEGANGGSAPSLSPLSGGRDPAPEWSAPLRNYPLPDTFSYRGGTLIAEYASDSLLNARVNLYLQRYRPETGVILISDLKTGHVLALGERQDSVISGVPRLAFGGGYPAASLAKILTATAALECNARELKDSIPQVGRSHTLYKRQLQMEGLRNVPRITLEEAFSRSVNPAFGMLGMSVGSSVLRATAARMGFNRPLVPAAAATSRIEYPDTGFSLAETACGFTAKTTISPWHALQIARGAGDDGRLRPCTFVRRMIDPATGAELLPRTQGGEAFISQANLPRLQAMMQATVRSGTSRKGFRQNLKAGHLDRIEVGGKTGSLDGEEIPGRFDWFIGYVKLKDAPDEGLAISIMLVHREYASIHGSAMAALLIRDWLSARDRAMRAAQAARPSVAAGPGPTPRPPAG